MEQTTLKVLVAIWACSSNKAIVLREKALYKTTNSLRQALCMLMTHYFFFIIIIFHPQQGTA